MYLFSDHDLFSCVPVFRNRPKLEIQQRERDRRREIEEPPSLNPSSLTGAMVSVYSKLKLDKDDV